MTKRIIYQQEGGGVAIIIPANCGLSIEEIAAKDVPFREVFTQTGTKVLTDAQYQDDPEYWDDEGFSIGESYPTGYFESRQKPYKIVDVADIPTDRQWRDAWAVSEADLTDGVGE